MANEYDEIVMVTPEMADKWLKEHGNKQNRTLRGHRVRAWVEYVQSGSFLAAREFAISFAEDGMLLNGHHRLGGIRAAGIPVQVCVRRNVSRDLLPHFDTNMTLRRNADMAAEMHGTNAGLDSAIRIIATLRSRTSTFLTPARMQELRNEFCPFLPDLGGLDTMKQGGRRIRAAMVAACLLACKRDRDNGPKFCVEVANAIRREGTSRPVLNLLRWMDNRGGVAGWQEAQSLLRVTLCAFEQYVAGKDSELVKDPGPSGLVDKYR